MKHQHVSACETVLVSLMSLLTCNALKSTWNCARAFFKPDRPESQLESDSGLFSPLFHLVQPNQDPDSYLHTHNVIVIVVSHDVSK